MATKYDLSTAARLLGIKKIGRNKIYAILRATGVVSEFNEPFKKYRELGYLSLGSRHTGRHYVTLVVGETGLQFLKFVVSEFLLQNPMPSFSRKSKIN